MKYLDTLADAAGRATSGPLQNYDGAMFYKGIKVAEFRLIADARFYELLSPSAVLALVAAARALEELLDETSEPVHVTDSYEERQITRGAVDQARAALAAIRGLE